MLSSPQVSPFVSRRDGAQSMPESQKGDIEKPFRSGLGGLVPSPSLLYLALQSNQGASQGKRQRAIQSAVQSPALGSRVQSPSSKVEDGTVAGSLQAEASTLDADMDMGRAEILGLKKETFEAQVLQSASWIDSAFASTLLPSMQWDAFQTVLDHYCLGYLSNFSNEPSTREAMLHLLGDHFVRRYYDQDSNPRLLHPPYMTDAQRELLLDEVRPKLINAIQNLIERENLKIDIAYFRYQAMVKGIFHNLLVQATKANDPHGISAMAGAGLARLCLAMPQLRHQLRSLAGHLLPPTLSHYLWWSHLFDQATSESIITRVRLDLANRNLKIGDHMSTTTLLKRVAKEIPDSMISREAQDIEAFKDRLVRIMAVYFLGFTPYSIDTVILSIPLMLALPKRSEEEMVVVLRTLSVGCIPSHPQETTTLAQGIIDDLKMFDPELHLYLTSSVHCEMANRKSKDAFGTIKQQALKEGWGTSPVEIISRWLARGFVGVVKPRCVQYIWDQCFFLGFGALSDFGIIILILIREFLMRAKSNSMMYDTFTTLPNHIFTIQICHAFVVFMQMTQGGGSPAQIGQAIMELDKHKTPLDSEKTPRNLQRATSVLRDIYQTGFAFADAKMLAEQAPTPRTARDTDEVERDKKRLNALISATKAAMKLKKLARKRRAAAEERDLAATAKYTGEAVVATQFSTPSRGASASEVTSQKGGDAAVQGEEVAADPAADPAAEFTSKRPSKSGRSKSKRDKDRRQNSVDQSYATAVKLVETLQQASHGDKQPLLGDGQRDPSFIIPAEPTSQADTFNPLPDLSRGTKGEEKDFQLPKGKLPMYKVNAASLLATAVAQMQRESGHAPAGATVSQSTIGQGSSQKPRRRKRKKDKQGADDVK